MSEPQSKKREREKEEESQPEEPQKSAKQAKVNEETKERMFEPMDAIKIATTIFEDTMIPWAEQYGYDDSFGEPAEEVFNALITYQKTGCAKQLLHLQESVKPFHESDSESVSSDEEPEWCKTEYPTTRRMLEKERNEKKGKERAERRIKAKRKDHWVNAKCAKCEKKEEEEEDEEPTQAVAESNKVTTIELSQESLAFIKRVLEAVEHPKGALEYFIDRDGYCETAAEIMHEALGVIAKTFQNNKVEKEDEDIMNRLAPEPLSDDDDGDEEDE